MPITTIKKDENPTAESEQPNYGVNGFGEIRITDPRYFQDLADQEKTEIDACIEKVEQQILDLTSQLSSLDEQTPIEPGQDNPESDPEFIQSRLNLLKWATGHYKFADAFLAKCEVKTGTNRIVESSPSIEINVPDEYYSFAIHASLGDTAFRNDCTLIGNKHRGEERHAITTWHHATWEGTQYSHDASFYLTYETVSFTTTTEPYNRETLTLSWEDEKFNKKTLILGSKGAGEKIPVTIDPNQLPDFLSPETKDRILKGDAVNVQATIEATLKSLQTGGRAPEIIFVEKSE